MYIAYRPLLPSDRRGATGQIVTALRDDGAEGRRLYKRGGGGGRWRGRVRKSSSTDELETARTCEQWVVETRQWKGK